MSSRNQSEMSSYSYTQRSHTQKSNSKSKRKRYTKREHNPRELDRNYLGHHELVPNHPHHNYHPSLHAQPTSHPPNPSSISLYAPSQHSSYHFDTMSRSRHSSVNPSPAQHCFDSDRTMTYHHSKQKSKSKSKSNTKSQNSRKLHYNSDPSRRGSGYTNNNSNMDYLPDIPDAAEVYDDRYEEHIMYEHARRPMHHHHHDPHHPHSSHSHKGKGARNHNRKSHWRRRHNTNIQHILKAVRREYQQQVDHVIDKWKELLDRAQSDVEKYRNIYHSERLRTKKLQQTIDQLRYKLKKYKNKDNENQVIILNLQQRLNELYDDLTEITTPSQTPYLYINTPKPQNIYRKYK